MLDDVIRKTYYELHKGKKFPVVLRFRLNNFGANEIVYEEFKRYFNLANKYEVFAFILDDNNLEDILRYASNYINDMAVDINSEYILDAQEEHKLINRAMAEEEKNYKKK